MSETATQHVQQAANGKHHMTHSLEMHHALWQSLPGLACSVKRDMTGQVASMTQVLPGLFCLRVFHVR